MRQLFGVGLAVLLGSVASGGSAQEPPASVPPVMPAPVPPPPRPAPPPHMARPGAAKPAPAPTGETPAPAMQPAKPPPAMPASPTEQAKVAEPPTEVGGKSLAKWVAEFKSEDPTLRDQAVKTLPLFGYKAVRETAIKPLLALLEDPDPGVRINAILVVSAIGFDKVEEVREATDKLAASLMKTVPGSMIRLHAARCLAGFGPEGHKAIPALRQAADDPSWEVRQAVAAALGRVGMPTFKPGAISADGLVSISVQMIERPPSEGAMQTLNLKLIRDPSAAVRLEACQALTVIGPPITATVDYVAKAAPYVRAISSRLKAEKDTGVKVWLQLLSVMYDERQFDAVLKSLGNQAADPNPLTRLQALQALQVLGPKAAPAMSSIKSAMFASEDYVACAGILTLVSLGSEARPALPDLERLARESKTDVVVQTAKDAIEAVKKTSDPDAPRLLPNRRPDTTP